MPKKKLEVWTGWHWLKEDCRLQFPPHTVVRKCQTLKADGPLSLCNNGLHASKLAIDALQYAPGPVICRVTLSGEILEGNDKACAAERTCLWWADATKTLHEFACWCATKALEAERAAGREPHEACWNAVATKLRWLKGEATDKELEAAWEAAWAAAWAAAREAAWAAARAAAWEAQNKRLEEMLFALAPKE